MSRTPIRIGTFPVGQDIWRVDWFGSIAFPDRLVRRKHPSVLVHLSKVTAPDPLTNPVALLDPHSTLPNQTKRWVSVGTMMLTGVGDLWQNQALAATPDYEIESFYDVQIDRGSAQMVKAGSSLEDEDGFLLPLQEHPWHRGNTHSYCIRVTLPDGRFLVVPCMELVRFYFGSSSELLTRLFIPPLTRDKLYLKAAWDIRRRKLFVQMAERMPAASAADVARVAGNEAAWRAAMLIPSSCLRASVAGREIYPQAAFPFEGVTDLVATGKWLARGGQPRQTFLVYQLRSCSHPFPFTALSYSVSGARQRARPDTAHHQAPPANGDTEEQVNRRHGSTRPAEPVLKEQDPSSTLAGHQYVARSRRDFPDLKRKTVWAKKAIAPKPGGEAGAGAAIRDIAIGESGSTQRVRPVSLVEAVSRAPEAVPAFLACVVDALQDLDGYDVEVLTCSESDGWTVPITLLADEDGVIADEHFVVEKSDQRPRRVAAFNVVKGRDCAVLAAVEAEQLMPFLYPVSGCDGDTLWQAIRCVAKDFVAVTGRGRKAGLVIDWRARDSSSSDLIKTWLGAMFEE